MTTMTFEEVQKDLASAFAQALRGEAVLVTLGSEAVRLSRDIPLRPPGYFAVCYSDPEDAGFEDRICRDSKPILEA